MTNFVFFSHLLQAFEVLRTKYLIMIHVNINVQLSIKRILQCYVIITLFD